MIKFLSCKEAAKKLKIDDSRVRQLIRAGRLPAQMIGRTYAIHPKDLKLVEHRKPGRPRKVEELHVDEDMLAKGPLTVEKPPKGTMPKVSKIPKGTLPIPVTRPKKKTKKRKGVKKIQGRWV